MTTTTVQMPSGMYKTTDDNGRVTYSERLPNSPGSDNAESGFVPNATGVVRTMKLAKDSEGKEVLLPIGKDGKAIPSREMIDAAKKKSDAAMERLTAEGKARAKAKAEAAAEEANKNKFGGVGFNIEASLTVPYFDYNLFEWKKQVGSIPDDETLSYDFDVGNKIKNKMHIDDVPTPGSGVSVGVSISSKGQKTLGMSKDTSEFLLGVQHAKEDFGKAKEKLERDAIKDPQAANDQYLKDFADITRKWGKKIAEAALK